QKVKDSMRVLLPVLLNKSHESYDKIRAILLYIFSTNGTTQENLDKLFFFLHIENDSDMIRNCFFFDVPVISSSTAQQHKHPFFFRSSEETFQLSRWIFFFKDVMECIFCFVFFFAIENKLDSKDWPYCSQCPPTWNGSGAV
ncbi:STXB3 protein, partial [Trogon melanurus]|nr:STXB3 protein [Trogon melanurus]